MKKHYGDFDKIFVEDSHIGEPMIEGSTITIPVTTGLMIFEDHPVGQGRSFYVDGFTIVFEGVTCSVREVCDYDENGNFVGEKRIIEDGPFPPARGPINQYQEMIFVTHDRKHYVVWDIDAEKFHLIEPDEPWEGYNPIVYRERFYNWRKKNKG